MNNRRADPVGPDQTRENSMHRPAEDALIAY
jgi:hypothetical protein